MIRERRRLGQSPLPRDPGPQHEITLSVAPLHENLVTSRRKPSPEMVANGETVKPD